MDDEVEKAKRVTACQHDPAALEEAVAQWGQPGTRIDNIERLLQTIPAVEVYKKLVTTGRIADGVAACDAHAEGQGLHGCKGEDRERREGEEPGGGAASHGAGGYHKPLSDRSRGRFGLRNPAP